MTTQMEAGLTHDIKMLEEKVRRLSERVSEFAKLPRGFGTIIHKARMDYACGVRIDRRRY